MVWQDETGIYEGGIHRSNPWYIVPRVIRVGNEIVFDFDWETRVLRASIEPKSLETLLQAQGWEPGRDVQLPNPLGGAPQGILSFPRVEKVEPVLTSYGQYYYGRIKHTNEGGVLAGIKRLMGR